MKKSSAKKAQSATARDLELLDYKKAFRINTQMQDMVLEKLTLEHSLSELAEEHLFDYLFNCMEDITFTQYLRKFGVTSPSKVDKATFKVTIDDGYCKYDYNLNVSSNRCINDIAVKLAEMGKVSQGKLQPSEPSQK